MINPRVRVIAGQGLRWSLAVLVNTLLNLIDGIAIGQQIFPRTDAFFQQFTIDAVCLYLVTTATAQLVYPMISSFGSAVTAGMMAETLPFLNAISLGIKKGYMAKYPDEEDLSGLMATLLVAFSIHGLLISGLFFLLVWLKLEGAVKKCPKYVLLGAMGGIGLFLIKTAVEQSGLKSLWVPLSGLVPALSVVSFKRRHSNPFIVPMTLILLISLFYALVSILGYTWPEMRDRGLLIPGPSSNIFPLRIYKFFSPMRIEWSLIWRVSPTILGSAVFAMLHLPINAPSFARSSKQTFSMNRELVANGVINLVTSACGLLPSYFIYTASVLFIQAGANSRLCSFFLAGTTGGSLLFAIPYMRFIPTCAVGFLLFYLGLELLTESVIDGYELTTNREYGVVLGMMSAMMVFGFAQGLLLGIIAAALTTLYDMRTMKASRVNPAPIIVEVWPNVNVYSPAENLFLETLRPETLFIELSGYYHFANTTEILDTIRAHVLAANSRFVLLDMRKTLRVDLNMVEGIQEMIVSEAFGMVQATVCVTKSRRLVKMEAGSHGRLKVLPDLGDAVGWVERLQLLELNIAISTRTEVMSRDLSEVESLISDVSVEEKLVTQSTARLEHARIRYAEAQEEESSVLSRMAIPTLVSVPSGGVLWNVGERLEAMYIAETGCFEEYRPTMLAPVRKYHRGAWIGYNFVRDQIQTETCCTASQDSTLLCYPLSSTLQEESRISSLLQDL